MKHAKRSGWRPFWAALCAALLVLLPLVGGTVLLSRAQLRSSLRQAAKSQSGVPIRLPKAADQCTVLLCVADETPGFVLAYLNAGQNCIHLLAVPAALEVPFGGKNVPLADCYDAAGPARCREALGEVFDFVAAVNAQTADRTISLSDVPPVRDARALIVELMGVFGITAADIAKAARKAIARK